METPSANGCSLSVGGVSRHLIDFAGASNLASREGRREVLLALLGVMDDFDRALTHASEAPEAFADGLRLVRRRLVTVVK